VYNQTDTGIHVDTVCGFITINVEGDIDETVVIKRSSYDNKI